MKITSLKKSVANLIAKVSYGEALKNANFTCFSGQHSDGAKENRK